MKYSAIAAVMLCIAAGTPVYSFAAKEGANKFLI